MSDRFPYHETVARLKTVADCDQFAKNVADSHPELVVQARRRAIELGAQTLRKEFEAKTEVEHAALSSLAAYEDQLCRKNGKKQRAVRLRKIISDRGLLKAISESVSKKSERPGFTTMVEAGLIDLTFEAVVLKFPNDFSDEAVKQARVRMGYQSVENP